MGASMTTRSAFGAALIAAMVAGTAAVSGPATAQELFEPLVPATAAAARTDVATYPAQSGPVPTPQGQTCTTSAGDSAMCWSVNSSGEFSISRTVGGDLPQEMDDNPRVEPELAAPATLVVSPADALIDHQVVRLSGAGYRANSAFIVEQCPTSAPSGSCDSNRTTLVATDEPGTLRDPQDSATTSAPAGVSAVIHPLSRSNSIDCRAAPGTCELRVLNWSQDRELAAAPLDFDASAPLDAPGTVTLDPDTDLIDGQVITVTADHQRPFALLVIYLCKAGGAIPDPGEFPLDECANYITAWSGNSLVDAAGVLTADFRVRATFTTPFGEIVDCRTTPCEIAVTEDPFVDDPITHPLPLDPDAPLAPAPSIVVQPSSDLADGDRVEVEGSDWFSGELVVTYQCLRRAGLNVGRDCLFESGEVERVGEDGRFETALVVTSAGRNFFDEPYDCRADPCDMVAFRGGSGGAEFATAPLSFAAIPRPPTRQPPPAGTRSVVVQPHFTG